ncbi:MAG: serine/threonine-protein kinase [Planctomycetota bacterium]
MRRHVGPYALEAELGRGGMGVVYRARDTRDGRAVAVKLVGELTRDLELLERFRREAEALLGLRHPNLVQALDWSPGPPAPYAVFELVEGETLAARVAREGPLPWPTAVRIASEVAAGLSAAHARGLWHRDLKPENVLLGPEGAKVADFGLVKDVTRESLTQSGLALGTPSYMAPEQVQGDRARHGPATDVYGVSATLLFALTGRPPFSAPTSAAVFEAVLHTAPPAPSAGARGLPPWVDEVVLRGLEKDPSRRYPTVLALRAALLAGLARGERSSRVGRPLGTTLVVVAALAAGGAALALALRPGASQPAPGALSLLHVLPVQVRDELQPLVDAGDHRAAASALRARLAQEDVPWRSAGAALAARFEAEAAIGAHPELAREAEELEAAAGHLERAQDTAAFLARVEELRAAGGAELAPAHRSAWSERCDLLLIDALANLSSSAAHYAACGGPDCCAALLRKEEPLAGDAARHLADLIAAQREPVFDPALYPRVIELADPAEGALPPRLLAHTWVVLAQLGLEQQPPAREAAWARLAKIAALPVPPKNDHLRAARLAYRAERWDLILTLFPRPLPPRSYGRSATTYRQRALLELGRPRAALAELRRLQWVDPSLAVRDSEALLLARDGAQQAAYDLLTTTRAHTAPDRATLAGRREAERARLTRPALSYDVYARWCEARGYARDLEGELQRAPDAPAPHAPGRARLDAQPRTLAALREECAELAAGDALARRVVSDADVARRYRVSFETIEDWLLSVTPSVRRARGADLELTRTTYVSLLNAVTCEPPFPSQLPPELRDGFAQRFYRLGFAVLEQLSQEPELFEDREIAGRRLASWLLRPEAPAYEPELLLELASWARGARPAWLPPETFATLDARLRAGQAALPTWARADAWLELARLDRRRGQDPLPSLRALAESDVGLAAAFVAGSRLAEELGGAELALALSARARHGLDLEDPAQRDASYRRLAALFSAAGLASEVAPALEACARADPREATWTLWVERLLEEADFQAAEDALRRLLSAPELTRGPLRERLEALGARARAGRAAAGR